MTKPRVLMIVENKFPRDIRVRKEAYSLKERYEISVVAIKGKDEKFFEVVDGIDVYRVPELEFTSQKGSFTRLFHKPVYILNYFYFTLVSLLLFVFTHLKKRYSVIHAHNPPDTLFVIGMVGKIFSVKFIFDHHDLSPELYLTRFSGKNDILHRTLLFLEKMSCRTADAVISTNESYKRIVSRRHGVDAKNIFLVRNDPAVDGHSPAPPPKDGKNGKKNLLYIGSINPQDGVPILIEAIHYIVNRLDRKDIVCTIVGDGDSLESIKLLSAKLGLGGFVEFKGYITDRAAIGRLLSLSDVCVEPAPDNHLNRHSTFIKVLEYMAAARPVVAFDLEETRYSTGGSAALLVRPSDPREFALGINRVLDDPELRKSLGMKGLERIRQGLNWNMASANLLKAYEAVLC